jgi:hypothetical protein
VTHHANLSRAVRQARGPGGGVIRPERGLAIRHIVGHRVPQTEVVWAGSLVPRAEVRGRASPGLPSGKSARGADSQGYRDAGACGGSGFFEQRQGDWWVRALGCLQVPPFAPLAASPLLPGLPIIARTSIPRPLGVRARRGLARQQPWACPAPDFSPGHEGTNPHDFRPGHACRPLRASPFS